MHDRLVEQVQLVFVGGAPRSGTTLIQRILNAHPNVYGGPEFDFVPQIMELRNRMTASILRGRISAIVGEAFLDKCFGDFLRNIFVEKANSAGAGVFSEKTPSNLLVFEELSTVFPDAKFICVIRDPRDVVASMKNVRLRAKQSGARAPSYCRNAMASVDYVNSYIEKADIMSSLGGRMAVIYYEEIVNDPEAAAKKLCAHIGIEFSPSMLSVENAEMDIANSESLALWYSKEELTAPIRRMQSEVHRKTLTNFEIAIVERRLRKSPLLHCYDIDPSKAYSIVDSMYFYTANIRARFLSTLLNAGRRIYSRL